MAASGTGIGGCRRTAVRSGRLAAGVRRRLLPMAVAVLALPACGGGEQAAAPPAAGTPVPTSSASSPAGGPPTTAPTATRSPAPPRPSARPATPRPTTPRPTGSPTAAPAFPASLAGRDVERIPGSGRVVALTFDAGANADAVPAILATLARERVPATFFLTGDFVADFPDPARRIAAARHRLGNHSVDHPHFPPLTTAEIRTQVLGAARAIRTVTGRDPAPLFRFPFGDRDARTISAVNALGYVPVRWTVDSLGWQGTMGGTRSASFVSGRVRAAATPGAIVLMHVGSHPTDRSMLDAEALPAIIAGLRQEGYRFVTLNALLA